MKKWYLFYSSSDMFSGLAHTIEESIDLNSLKLQQVGAEIEFPAIFGFVPWRHHVEIVTKCKTLDGTLMTFGLDDGIISSNSEKTKL